MNPQESDSNSATTDSSPETTPDYDSDNGWQKSRAEHSRTLSTSDMEKYLGNRLPKIRKKVLRKRVHRKPSQSKSSVVTSEEQVINVKGKLSPKIEEKNICDLFETASKSDTSHDVEVDVMVISISSTERGVNDSQNESNVRVKEEPNTSSCSTLRILNTYLTQQSTQNGSQEDESK